MKRLTLGNIPLPQELEDIWVCKTRKEVETCESNGYKYIYYKGSSLRLLQWVLLKPLEKVYPYIKWKEIWHLNGKQPKIIFCNEIESFNDGSSSPNSFDEEDIDSDIAIERRWFTGGTSNETQENVYEVDLTKYMSDIDIYVDIEELDRLELLPKWFSDIYEAIAVNTTKTKWRNGYNKKRKLCVGYQEPVKELRNLIICDVSHSIPYGIAATMLTLLDTMRHKVHADLIVTGATSYFWSYEEDIPSPGEIRSLVPRSNEDPMFTDILFNKLKGKEYNHVISFGDNDSWGYGYRYESYKQEDASPYIQYYNNNVIGNNEGSLGLHSIRVHNVHHYHTWSLKETGYALWCKHLNPDCQEYRNNDWCKGIKENEY